jgi:hypothetical protein
MKTNRIYMDLKFNKYGIDGEVLSLALTDGVDRTLYLENSDYDIINNSGWIPGDTAVANRLLVNNTPQFPENIESHYVPLSEFQTLVNEWLNSYTKVIIHTVNPLSWILFLNVFGTISDLPNIVEPYPVFLQTLFLQKGLELNTDIDVYIHGKKIKVIYENALYDVKTYKAAYEKILNLIPTVRSI